MGRKRRANKSKQGCDEATKEEEDNKTNEELETKELDTKELETNEELETKELDTKELETNEELETKIDTRLYTVEASPIYGRFLKTRVDIRKGTLLLSEKYLVAGPMRSSDIVCVGCHSDMKNGKKRCPRCDWPICKRTCADSIFHQEECKFFVQNQVKA